MSPLHSERCLSVNRFGDGFDCICGGSIDRDPEPEPQPSVLQPLRPGEEGVVLLAKIDSLPRRQATWLYWFRMACNVAMDAQCHASKCGAVIVGPSPFSPQVGTYRVFEQSLVSVAFNGPPGGSQFLRRCGQTVPSKWHPKADRTCCVHAEARAILNAPRDRLRGSKLYFARVDASGNLLSSGRPYCVGCSKLAVEVGIQTWVLWHEDGPREYEAHRYHELSLRYDELMDEEEAAERGSKQQAASSGSGSEPDAYSLQPDASSSFGPEDFPGCDYLGPHRRTT